MRDGTLLSAYPMPVPPEMGPYPTVVNYSGYDPLKARGAVRRLHRAVRGVPCAVRRPSDQSAFIASMFGYATVGVNVRRHRLLGRGV